MALETPSRPPPLHGKCHLKFPFWLFDYFPFIKHIKSGKQERKTFSVLITNLKFNSKRKKKLKTEGLWLFFAVFDNSPFLSPLGICQCRFTKTHFKKHVMILHLALEFNGVHFCLLPYWPQRFIAPTYVFCGLGCAISQVAWKMHWIYPPTFPAQW